jgi:hypothetical protein
MAKSFSDAILKHANTVVAASKSLDYQGIIDNDQAAVSQLNTVLEQLSIKKARSDESLENYASKQEPLQTSRIGDDQSDILDALDWDLEDQGQSNAEQRREEITSTIAGEGLEGHIGRVYNSFASDRVLDFKSIPHQRGLPPFDLVFAADYSPFAGLHGIFINSEEVMSIVLPSDAGLNGEWQILKSRKYTNQEEMMEFVTLLSAGFELP